MEKFITFELDSQFSDYQDCLKTIGAKVRLTKIGNGEVVSCEILNDKIISKVELKAFDNKSLSEIDIYPQTKKAGGDK